MSKREECCMCGRKAPPLLTLDGHEFTRNLTVSCCHANGERRYGNVWLVKAPIGYYGHILADAERVREFHRCMDPAVEFDGADPLKFVMLEKRSFKYQ